MSVAAMLRRLKPWGAQGPAALFQRGVELHDAGAYMEAFQVWRRAAEGGSSEAAFRLGELYIKKQGVMYSIADAKDWYERAAEAGHIDAQLQLGKILLHGGSAPLNAASFWKSALE